MSGLSISVRLAIDWNRRQTVTDDHNTLLFSWMSGKLLCISIGTSPIIPSCSDGDTEEDGGGGDGHNQKSLYPYNDADYRSSLQDELATRHRWWREIKTIKIKPHYDRWLIHYMPEWIEELTLQRNSIICGYDNHDQLSLIFTRDSIYAIARICYRPSVRPSVCLSVRRWYHRKTVEVRIMQFSPYGSPIHLVFVG